MIHYDTLLYIIIILHYYTLLYIPKKNRTVNLPYVNGDLLFYLWAFPGSRSRHRNQFVTKDGRLSGFWGEAVYVEKNVVAMVGLENLGPKMWI